MMLGFSAGGCALLPAQLNARDIKRSLFFMIFEIGLNSNYDFPGTILIYAKFCLMLFKEVVKTNSKIKNTALPQNMELEFVLFQRVY
jgi:hypothetical protein